MCARIPTLDVNHSSKECSYSTTESSIYKPALQKCLQTRKIFHAVILSTGRNRDLKKKVIRHPTLGNLVPIEPKLASATQMGKSIN